MSNKRVSNKGPLTGNLELPGDKSISHRAAMLLAISDGNARISNFAPGDDCDSTINCLRQLGVSIKRDGAFIEIFGQGKHGMLRPAGPLDCGNSGTTMRLLAGILAGQRFDSILTGDSSLNSRPMVRIAEPLWEMGADVRLNGETAPIDIRGGRELKRISYELPVPSAQVRSCVLFAGMFAEGSSEIIGPESASPDSALRDHSERMLRYLGASVEERFSERGGYYRQVTTLEPPESLSATNIDVPGDISAATFFLVAAAGIPGSDITLVNVGLNPTRRGIFELMKECGLRIAVINQNSRCAEPRGDVRITWDGDCELGSETLRIKGNRTAGLIDEIPALAVLGTRLPGGVEIRDASELRLKESDRISSVAANLRKMGAGVEEFEDGFRVMKSELFSAELDSFGDHRIAMAGAVAAMFANGESSIKGADCVSVSYPDFFDDLSRISSNDN